MNYAANLHDLDGHRLKGFRTTGTPDEHSAITAERPECGMQSSMRFAGWHGRYHHAFA
jgi:hypothetical protein